ncbi:MAG: hypothetical protein R8P61_06165 [Bacteroidia bacterium]|nr:hypothetical protein [Bacteroidia bacterium]
MSSIDLGLQIFSWIFFFLILAYVIYKHYWTRKLFGDLDGIPLKQLPLSIEIQKAGSKTEVRTKVDYSGELYEIDRNAYSRFIILKKSTLSFLTHKLEAHAELTGTDEMEEHIFLMAERRELQILKLADTLSLNRYHDFASWFMFAENKEDIPEICVGIAFHFSDRSLDYCFWKDLNKPSADTLIGRFRNGNSFFIYLPEEDQGKGTIRLQEDLNPEIQTYEQELAYFKFDKAKLDSLDYKRSNIMMNPY